MSAVPLRYLPWMLRDLVLAQGLVLAGSSVVIGLIWGRLDPAPPASAGPMLVAGIIQQVGWPFILYCTGGIVSSDRIQGYYRSIFSRPVAPPWYYLQRWLVGAFITLLMVPVVTAAMVLALGKFPMSWGLVARVELTYLLLGGIVFLASTLLRIDWLIGLVLLLLNGILSQLTGGPPGIRVDLPPLWDFLYRMLPPFHLTAVNAPSLTGPQLTHVLLYGIGLVLAALAVLRWRPLGAGGRA